MDETTKLLLSFLSSVIVAILTAIVTVRLSLRRFYSERWWERKSEAYSRIIESLYQFRHYANDLIDVEETGKEIPPERREQLATRSEEGMEEISKSIAIGSFLISDEAVDQLNQFVKEHWKIVQHREQSSYEMLERDRDATDECIAKIRECAKKDLKVK